MRRILRGVDQRWLTGVGVYVCNASGLRVLEAEIQINWQLHSDLTLLTPVVRSDLPGWQEGAAPEVQVIGRRFGTRARDLGLAPHYWVRFPYEARRDRSEYERRCRELGVSSEMNTVPRWQSEPSARTYDLLDLVEVNVGLREV